MSTKRLAIWVAGTSQRTASCLQTLLADDRICVEGVLTPFPQRNHRVKTQVLAEESPTGRSASNMSVSDLKAALDAGELTPNPVHSLALTHQLATVLVTSNRIDGFVRHQIEEFSRPDILLVVDFGYFIPSWLLAWPMRAPINIHPSQLPRWRGSSPGQFALLYGEVESAVTVMVMNEGLDTGPVITQLPFPVEATWTSAEYYAAAFTLINQHLVEILLAFDPHQKLIPQPEESPTPIARKLNREDGFISWSVLKQLLAGTIAVDEAPIGELSPLMLEAQGEMADIYRVIANAYRAMTPWPGLWTQVSTSKGEKRLKILRLELVENPHRHLELTLVQLEGQQPATPASLKSLVPDFNQ